MELEVESQTGAAYGEKKPERLAQRNGYRDFPERFTLVVPAINSKGHETDRH
jgi:hypothetical protein